MAEMQATIEAQAATIQAQEMRIAVLESGDGAVHVGSSTTASGGYSLGIWESALPANARATPDNRCNANAEVLAGQDNNGPTAMTPSRWDPIELLYKGCGYAWGYLHLLTDVPCGSGGAGGVFSFGVTGVMHHLGPFDCRVSAYSNDHFTVTHSHAACSYGDSIMSMEPYCSSAQAKIAIRLGAGDSYQDTASRAAYWHASSISVAAYSRSNTATVLQALHSSLEDEDFAVGVDRRAQVAGESQAG